MLQGWGTLLGAGAVIYAAKKGADTFESWKRQKVAERRSDQAERILTATYKARRALKFVRSPMMWAHELNAAEKKLKEDAEEWKLQTVKRQRRLVTAQGYFNRLNKTVEERQELTECLPMARALFDEQLEKALEELSHQFWIVEVDVDSYIDDEGDDAEFSQKIRRGMYDISPREGQINEVSDKITTSVKVIEGNCLPALRLT